MKAHYLIRPKNLAGWLLGSCKGFGPESSSCETLALLRFPLPLRVLHYLRLVLPFSSAAASLAPSDLPSQPEESDEVVRDTAMGDSQYSFSLTTFSPSGKLVQIEHALTAVGSGQTSLGIKAANGVVIATEKKLPSILVDETSVQKIQSLTPNIGVVYSGMGLDFRVLVRKSRKQAQQYYQLYKETIPVTQLVRETAAVMQEFTQSGGVRPFGVSLLIAGYDDNGPQLYQVDPSGSYFSWKASAMGKNVSNAKTFLEKRYTEDMELDDAIHTAILTLKEGYEGQISANNIEIGVIRADREFKVLTPAEIKDFLEEVE
ncbi:hypothetical protein ACQ4PT_040502 [Festuca glaucescens]